MYSLNDQIEIKNFLSKKNTCVYNYILMVNLLKIGYSRVHKCDRFRFFVYFGDPHTITPSPVFWYCRDLIQHEWYRSFKSKCYKFKCKCVKNCRQKRLLCWQRFFYNLCFLDGGNLKTRTVTEMLRKNFVGSFNSSKKPQSGKTDFVVKTLLINNT